MIFGLLGELGYLGLFFFEAHLVGGCTEFASEVPGHLGIEGLVDGGENLLLHQFLDDQVSLDTQLLRQFFYSDAIGDGNFTIDRRWRSGLIAPHGLA